MKIFLTGGTGFIGQPLTRSLLRRGWSVTAQVRDPGGVKAQALAKMGAQLVPGDVTMRESMRAPMTGVDIVVHNAGIYEYGLDRLGVQRMRLTNINGTEKVLGLARELNIPRSVYVSSLQAFGGTGQQPCDETFLRKSPCGTAYEQSKMEAHEIALRYQQQGLPLIITCPNQVIGPNDNSPLGYFMRLYINRLLPPVACGRDSIFCCVELNDLAEGIALAAEKGKPGETYFFCGDPQPFHEIFDCWRRRPGALLPPVWLPAGLASVVFGLMTPILKSLHFPAFLSSETARVALRNWNYSSEKAQRELGWKHCSAEAMWLSSLDREIHLLEWRKSQTLLQRLMPLKEVDWQMGD